MLYLKNALAILLLFILTACNQTPKQQSSSTSTAQTSQKVKDTLEEKKAMAKEEKDTVFKLTDDNAIPFFYEYEKTHKQSVVKVYTSMGDFVIQLYKNTPYHRANFIYLAEKKYFNRTYFHRVVKDFIIQGGNTDLELTSIKRDSIGAYLLPPDTRKGHKHVRGTVSMPSSDDVSNPHKLASPYEFFIVTTDTGASHLDGKYTAFGTVISGMEVVDKINQVPTDKAEWPLSSVIIDSVQILE